MTDLKKKSRGELEAYVRELEGALGKGTDDSCAPGDQSSEPTGDEIWRSDQRFRALVENAPDSVVVLDANGTVLYNSPSAPRMLGYDGDENLGADAFAFIHPDDISSIADLFDEVVKTPGAARVTEGRIRHRDGSWRHVESKAANHLDNAAVEGIVINLRDITERKLAENALKVSERRFRQLFTNVYDQVTFVDLNGVIFDVNDRAREIFGFSREELVGRTFPDLGIFSEATLSLMSELFEQSVAAQGPVEPRIEVPAIHRDGHDIYIEASTSLLTDESGEFIGFVAIIRDITASKTAAEKLREAEARYNALFHNPLQLGYVHDEEAKFLDANEAALDRLGYSKAELGSISFQDIVHPADLSTALNAHLEVMEKGYAENPIRIRLLSRSGEVIWVETCGFAIDRAPGSFRTIGIARDITDQKQAEEELERREREYATLVELSPDGIVVLEEGQIIFMNERAGEIFGYAISECVGKHFAELMAAHPPVELSETDIDALVRGISRGLKSGGTDDTHANTISIPIRNGAGETRWIEISRNPIEYRGKQARLGFIRDITERKEHEEALRESQQKFKQIFDNANDEIIYVDTLGNIIDVNARARELTGYRPDEVIGRNLADLDLWEPEEFAAVAEEFAKATMAGGENVKTAFEVEARHHAHRGRVSLEVSTNAITDIHGEVTGFVSIIRDITERKRANQALRESEERYRLLIDNYRGPINVFDTDGNILVTNIATAQVLGGKPEEWIGRSILEMFPDQGEGLLERNHRIIESGVGAAFEDYFELPSGKLWYWSSLQPVRNAAGEIVAVQVISHDITERKKAEDELRKSEEKYRRLAENMHILVAVVDPDGTYVYANRAHEVLTGYEADRLVGKNAFHFIHAEDRERMVRACTLPEDEADVFEARFECDDGFHKWFQFHISALYDEDGSVQLTLVVGNDITHSKRAEVALRASEEKLRAIFDNINDEVLYLDKFGNIIEVNRRIEDILGYTAEEVIGKNFLALGTLDDSDLVSMGQLFVKSMQGVGGQGLLELEIIHKNGTPVPIEASVNVLKKDDRTEGIFAVIRDISERRRAEEEIQLKNEELLAAHDEQRSLLAAFQEQNRTIGLSQLELEAALQRAITSEEEVRSKNEELLAMQEELREINQHLEERVEERTSEIAKLLQQKESFITQLAHDLRSPLTPLVALLPMMRDKQTDAKSRAIADMAVRNIDYMEDLVGNTIKLAKLSTDARFEIGAVSPSAIVDVVLKREEYQLSTHGVTFENRIDRHIVVAADKLRLAEVFENIATNAIKFMSDGGHLTFDARTEGDFAILLVQDTGIGITTDQLGHIFEEFYKADPSRHDLGSSGLGLAICQRIVEKHGGTIWAESEGPGCGTTFFFSVPIYRED